MKNPTLQYTCLAYGITWLIVICGYILFKYQLIDAGELNFIHSIGAIGPTLAAFATAKKYYGLQGTQKLCASISIHTTQPGIIIIMLSPIVLFVAGYLLYPFMAGHWYNFADTQKNNHLNNTWQYAGWLLPFITYAVFEEIGWRGFLLPHLQQKYRALPATIYLTLIWALWHAPFFLYRFEPTTGMITGFVMGLFCGAIILTHLFNQSNGSTGACIIFHLLNNIASAFDKKYIVATMSTGFVLLAIYLLWRFKATHLASHPKNKWSI